jgi:hypothetical protein
MEVLMMPVIRISDKTFERMKKFAEPFVHSPDDIVNLALDALEQTRLVKVPAPSPSGNSRAKPKLPQKEFEKPLLQVLYELGGGGSLAVVRPIMERKMREHLKEGDFDLVSTGEPRWWNATCWARSALVQEGLLRSDSDRGYWELSETGLALVVGESLAS